MAQLEGYTIKNFMKQNSVPKKPPKITQREEEEEEEERKFNVDDVIAVLSSDDSEEEEPISIMPIISNIEEARQDVSSTAINIQPMIQAVTIETQTQTKQTQDVSSSAINVQPIIQAVSSIEVPNRNEQGQCSMFQELPQNPNFPFEELLKTVAALTETVKSLKNNFENFDNSCNLKKKHKKRRRRRYSSDSTSSDYSSSSSDRNERRRKRRRHHHKSSRSYRKRYLDSDSECSSVRKQKRYRRDYHHYHKHDESTKSKNVDRSITQPYLESMSHNSTPVRMKKSTLRSPNYQNGVSCNANDSLRNESSSSLKKGIQTKRRSTKRQSCEKSFTESEDSESRSFSSQNAYSLSKSFNNPVDRSKTIDAKKRRHSMATEIVVVRDAFRPPNTNKNLYFASKHANKCQICSESPARIVNHYKRSHETSEIYVSRISPKMAEKARNGQNYAKLDVKSKLKALCYFCEDKKEFPAHYWGDHYRSHTGEYAYRCDGCSSTYSNSNRGCCGKRGLTKIYNDDLTCIDLTAFVCGLCNYLQIDEKSMRKHLLNEHEIVGGIFDNQYDKIVLLPSVKKLNKRLM